MEFPATTEYFHKNKYGKNGLAARCKLCMNEYRSIEYNKKTCTKCRKELTRSDFHKDKSKEDGLNGHCKSCRAENAKRYYKSIQDERLDNYEFKATDYGVADKELDIKLIKGHRYHVPVIRGKYGKKEREFTGRLIQETKDLVILQHKRGFCECFRKMDFLTGEYEIKEA